MNGNDDFDIENDAADTGLDTGFVWPNREWFEVQGASMGLDDDEIRFAAAIHALGGVEAKKHTQAARNAGLDWDRVNAFRKARSATIGKLLREAWEVKEGRVEPLTEQEVDWRIDRLIRSPDALTCAKGIELREKRKAAKYSDGATEEYLNRPDKFIATWLKCFPESYNVLVGIMMCLWPGEIGMGTGVGRVQPLLEDLIPHIAHEFPEVWKRLLVDAFSNDWERKCFGEDAEQPRRSLNEIYARVQERGLDSNKRIDILSPEQFEARRKRSFANGHVVAN